MPLKVVYVDDEEDLVEMFSACFDNTGIEVHGFTQFEKALDYVKTSPPDVFFVDYRLSGTTGDEVAERAHSLIGKKIIYAMITGELTPSTQFPFDKIFFKPYLLRDIKEYLESCRENLVSGDTKTNC